MTAIGAAAAIALAAPASVLAEDLQATPVSPLPDTTYLATSGSLAVEFRTPLRFTESASPRTRFEVSASPTLGQDGTLADDLRIAWTDLRQRDSDPSAWYGSVSSYGWANTPGTYYFQFSTSVIDFGTSNPGGKPICSNGASHCMYTSPVYTVRTQQPQAGPAFTLKTAAVLAKSYVRRNYRARNPTAFCKRLDATAVWCGVAWRVKRKRRAIEVKVYADATGNVITRRIKPAA